MNYLKTIPINLLIPLLGWHLWITHIEESRLEQKFGDEYRSYKNKVPRWVSLKGLLLFVHIWKAFAAWDYYPGLITALGFPLIGFLFWKELTKLL